MANKYRHEMRRARMGLQNSFGFRMSAQNGNATIDIYDTIGADWMGNGITAKTFKQQLEALGDIASITLRINSPGGDVMDGFTIFNLLCEHPAEKTAIVDGMAASIASVICMSCDKIIMKEASFFMIHNPYLWTMGGADQLRQDADMLDKMKTMAIAAYKHKSSLSEAEISSLMDGPGKSDGTWMTPQDALDNGFIDEIDVTPDEGAKNRTIHKGKLSIPDEVMAVLQGKTPPKMRILEQKPPAEVPKPPQQGVQMDKCPVCGKEVTAGVAFCNHCGANMKTDPGIAMKAAHDREVAEAKADGARVEGERISGIQALCRKFNMTAEFQAKMIADKIPLAQAAQTVADGWSPMSPGVGIAITADASDKFMKRACLSLIAQGNKAGLLTSEEKASLKGAEPVQGIHGLVRDCLFSEGVVDARKISNLDPSQLADHAIRLAGVQNARMEASSELGAILADVANKILDRQASLAAVTYAMWTGVVQAKDFKPLHITNLSEFSDIQDIAEGKDFEFGRVSDKQEIVNLSTKGIAHVLTRKTIINDDLGALTRIPAAIANSWERRKDKDVYDALVSNTLLGPTMTEDSIGFFNAATHGNLIATSGAVTHAHIGAARLAMQKVPLLAPDKTSVVQYSGYVPKYLVTGVNNRTAIEQLLGAPYDIAIAGSAVSQAPNLFRDIVPIFSPYLQALLTAAGVPNAWYMFTDPTIADHFVVSYLQGLRVPYLRSMPSMVSQALGIKWDIFGEYGVGVANWRTGVYCDGQ
jgi:ATP-dependent protease ClpP protease subunit